MRKIFYNILLTTLVLFLSGCGGGGNSGGGGGGAVAVNTHSYAGPTSCKMSYSSSFVKNLAPNPLPAGTNPFSVATALELKQTPSNPYQNPYQIKIGIVGGIQVTGSSTPATAYPAHSNTVGIVLPVGNTTYLCTGVLVAVSATESLIVTAGHCFDYVNPNSASPGYAVFTDAINISNPLSTGGVLISCWQRNSNYLSCKDSSIAQCVLNDIAWVKVAVNASAAPYNYTTINILADPTTITAAEVKTMAGFGKLNDGTSNTGNRKYIVDTQGTVQGGSGEPQGQDCPPPNGSASSFNSQTFSGAYENYLTVIGPYYGHGTCEGDSGGPVYVNRSGAVLAALTQGTNNLLTPLPTNGTSSSPTVCGPGLPGYTYNTSYYADCSSGFGVYTTVGNYVTWLKNTSGATCNLASGTYSCTLP